MTRHLLDADAIIDYLDGFAPTVQLIQRLNRQGDIPCACAVVTGEVYAGLRPEDEERAERFLSVLEFLPTTPQAARQAGRWKYRYQRQGTQLGIADCLIASVALEHGAMLVTRNLRDYPMPELTLVPLPQPQR